MTRLAVGCAVVKPKYIKHVQSTAIEWKATDSLPALPCVLDQDPGPPHGVTACTLYGGFVPTVV